MAKMLIVKFWNLFD